ncbi:MAG: ATP-binding protein [Myxococcales bacterium]|nr:ATP-binding protein [Myxococcales bacterium]
MIRRLTNLSELETFFLFGARGTGKSTLIWDGLLPLHPPERVKVYDLLDPEVEDRLIRSPERLEQEVRAHLTQGALDWVVIDEVQKAPRLLDVVHRLIVSTGVRFALTGSSARKLRRGAANLLAGRAVVHHLAPFSFVELGDAFDLDAALRFGGLPGIILHPSETVRSQRLRAYALTYLREEVQLEQLTRRLDPFREFLEVAAQHNGQVLNMAAIARDVGRVDDKTIRSFFDILEDTLVGFFLPAWDRSVRRAQGKHPKFYLFDPGVKRALDRTLDVPLHPRTAAFGEAFEHLVIAEAHRLNETLSRDFRLSYFATKDGAEIDLILSGGNRTIAIEIKSADRVDPDRLHRFESLTTSLGIDEAYWLSRDPTSLDIGAVKCREWRTGLRELMRV